MDAAVWGFVGVVVGGIIAGAVAIIGELLRGSQESNLDSKKRQDDRRIERNRIQRETLLALQPKLVEWMRQIALMHQADADAFRTTGRRAPQYPDGVSNDEMLRGRELMYLTERVLDDDLRGRVKAMRSMSLQALTVTTERDLEDVHLALARETSATLERIGSVLRAYL